MLLGMAGVAPLAFSRDWERPAFPDWSPEFADRILTESPWAHPLDVPFVFRPRQRPGGVGVHTEIYLTIRWSSGLPVRQALALEQWGREGIQSPAARELLEAKPDAGYLIEVFGIPATTFPDGVEKLEAELARTASLFLKGRKAVQPESVTVPPAGMHLSAAMRFPRYTDLTGGEGIIEFAASAGPVKIAAKFKLKDMMYRGRLEL